MATIARFVGSIPPDTLADGFDRTETGQWGLLDGASPSMRPRWGFDTGAGSNYAVSGGTGRISISAVNAIYVMLVSTRMQNFDQRVTITIPVVATGGPIYLGLYGPYISTSQHYKAELVFNTDSTVDVRIRKLNPTGSNLVSAPTGLTYVAGDRFTLRYQLEGSTWRAKVWRSTDPEPEAWTVTAVEVPVLSFGRIGVSAIGDSATTNPLPLLIEFDDFSATPAPAVRLDLMGCDPWSVVSPGTDLSPPRLRRAAASTMLRDGATYPASAYDDRRITLRLALKADTTDDSAAALQDLAREVDKPTNILQWQWTGMSEPVYFRTIRSDLTKITEYPAVPCGSLRTIDVDLLAEPFAYGAQQILPTATVTNDPAAASNAQKFDITADQVLGDVDTQAIVRFNAPAVDGQQTLLAVRRRSLVGALYELQLEIGNNQTDTTGQPNDPVMSGAGINYKRTTFATNTTLVNRVTWAQFPTPDQSSAYRGKYRVLLRYRKSVAGDTIQVRLMWAGLSTADAIVGDTVTLAATTDRRYADLGVVSLPPGADPVEEGQSGLLWPASGVPLALQAARPSGSGNLDMDVLVFVPADDRQVFNTWPTPMTGYAVVDGVDEMAYEQSTDIAGTGPGPIGDALGVPAIGTFPMLSPGVDNRMFVLPNVGTTGGQDTLTDTVDVNVDYWPRFLYVRPPAS